MKKVQIHEFDPVIYPIRLYVAYTDNLQAVLENFIATDNKDLKSEWGDCLAYSFYNIFNKEKTHSFLIVFKSKKKNHPNIAHEATHTARMIWELLGEDETGVEADAYLVEWIVKCCLEVK